MDDGMKRCQRKLQASMPIELLDKIQNGPRVIIMELEKSSAVNSSLLDFLSSTCHLRPNSRSSIAEILVFSRRVK